VTDERVNRPEPDPLRIDSAEAAELLALGLTGPYRPVDLLIDRLRARDGAAWFERTLSEPPIGEIGDAKRALLEGEASLEDLNSLKERAKSAMVEAEDLDATRRAVAAYLLAATAALAHHGRSISSRRREELYEALIDLASAAPERWAAMLRRAAEASDENASQ